MGKDKGQKGKRGKKQDKGSKLRKEVAGVKVPKGLRKAGKAALKLAEQPAVSEAVAAALLAAAAALRETPMPKRGGAAAAGEAGREAPRQAGGLGDALKAIALEVARRTVEAWEEGARQGKGKAAKGG